LVLRYFQWFFQGVGQAGKMDNNESGTQELRKKRLKKEGAEPQRK